MSALRRFRRSRSVLWGPLCQGFLGQTTSAPKPHSGRCITSFKVRNTARNFSSHGAAAQDDEVGTSAPWTIIQRPILETLLKSYAHHPTVAQPLILHGPRGVGKRTVVERLAGKWNKSPHICAYLDLNPNQDSIPPWTTTGRFGGYHESIGAAFPDGRGEGQDFATLGTIQTQLEQGLYSLTRKAVETGCVNSENVLDALLERHSIDGALGQYLRTSEGGSTPLDAILSKPTKVMWKQSLQLVKQEDKGAELSNNSSSRQQGLSGSGMRKTLSTSRAQSIEETLMSLALAKKILKIQEDWKVSAGSNLKSEGIVTRRSADAATSWAVLLLRLLSFAAQEGHFQPKLVINNLDLMRKAPAKVNDGSVHGSLYHDSLLMHITRMGVNGGCLPIIIVSSDSYYSCKIFADHGDELAFISHEVLGWTPKEAAIHLVPAIFEESELLVKSAVEGGNGYTGAYCSPPCRGPFNLEQPLFSRETNENAMGDCIDLYLGYLQVTAVDPAMESAINMLEKFAEDCSNGKISKRFLRHGVPWRHPPSDPGKHRLWAKMQLLDYIQAMAATDFGVNHRDVRAQELLEDPSTNALLEVGLFYQQKDIPYLRPISRGVSRCLVRWHVRERLNWSFIEKLEYSWHRLIRGRFYKQLVIV